MHQIDQFVSTNLSNITRLSSGFYRGLKFLFEGTNATGTPVARSNFGDFKVTINGKVQTYGAVEYVAEYTERKLGNAENASAGSGAYSIAVYLPFVDPDDPSASFYVSENDNVQVQIQFDSGIASLISSGDTCTIFADKTKGITHYFLKMQNHTIAVSNNGLKTEQLPVENLIDVVSSVANIGRVRLSVDGDELFDLSDDALESNTTLFSKPDIAYAAPSFFLYSVAKSRSLDEILNDNCQLSITGDGTGDTVHLLVSADFDPNRKQASREAIERLLSAKLARKQAAGRTRPIQSLS